MESGIIRAMILSLLLMFSGVVNALEELILLGEIAASTADQLTTLSKQFKFQENQYKEMKKLLGSYPSSSASQDIEALFQLMQKGDALAISASTINSQFEKTFSGYTQAKDFDKAYQSWAKTSHDSIGASLNVAHEQSKQIKKEEEVFSKLRTMAKKPEGQMQALQIGSQIALEQASQMQKLRTLIMAQMQAETAYMAANQQQKDNQKAVEKNFFEFKNVMKPHYKGF
jgi:P-type conjugative transfer protein TrbJ